MIFLTVGIQFPFDRLVRTVDNIFGQGLINEEIFAHPDKAEKMGRARHEYVTNNLTWDHVAERVLSVIESQCAG